MKKNLLYWLIYDAANSFLHAALGGFFLAQWVVIDNKFDDIWYGATFSLATILVLITSPILGAWSDSIGKRLPFIKWLTVLLVLFYAILAVIAPSSLPIENRIVIALFLAVILQYLYQQSLVFYNSLLEEVSTSKTRGKISGLGEMFGNSGWIVATAILLSFANKKFTLIGEPGRAQIFLPSFLFFTVLSLPMLIKFKEMPKKVVIKEVNIKDVLASTVKGVSDLFHKNKNAGLFLLSFTLMSDVILTIQLYFAIVMEAIFKIPDSKKFLITLLMFLSMIVANYFLGKLSDKFGSKKIIILSGVSLVITLSIVLLSSAPFIIFLLAPFIGIGWGGFYVATRSMMIEVSPRQQLGEYFGFYSTFQRFASITGPLLWGGITLALKSYGVIKYRVAGLSLVVLMIFGIYILTKVKEQKVFIKSQLKRA